MSADQDLVFQDSDDQRQRMNDQLAEMMSDQEFADRAVLARVRKGETHYGDFLYLVGRLNYNVNELEK